jgi:hypothetical protein
LTDKREIPRPEKFRAGDLVPSFSCSLVLLLSEEPAGFFSEVPAGVFRTGQVAFGTDEGGDSVFSQFPLTDSGTPEWAGDFAESTIVQT